MGTKKEFKANIMERLEAVQCIVASSCNKIEAQCAYDELDDLIPQIREQLSMRVLQKRVLEYTKIEKALENLPITWYPGLFDHLIKQCIKMNVFKKGLIGDWAKAREKQNREEYICSECGTKLKDIKAWENHTCA